METDGNQTYWDDHFVMYINIESCCIPEMNTILYINYSSIKKIQFGHLWSSCTHPPLPKSKLPGGWRGISSERAYLPSLMERFCDKEGLRSNFPFHMINTHFLPVFLSPLFKLPSTVTTKPHTVQRNRADSKELRFLTLVSGCLWLSLGKSPESSK